MLKTQQFQKLSGLEYLQADIACKHDKAFEKRHWDERIAHFHTLVLSDPKTFKKASNPIGLRAAQIALTDYHNMKPSGYLISLDAASSGLQLLSLLSSCPTSWKLCGGDENILDGYIYLYNSMDTSLGLERSEVKQTIMTAFYGSEAMPKAIFGDNVDEFYNTMEVMAPGAWDLNLGIQALWDEVEGSVYDWTLPDNFYACVETKDKEVINFKFLEEDYQLVQVINERPRFHKGLGPNMIHSIDALVVREMGRRCNFDSKQTVRITEAILSGASGTTGRSAEMVKILWEHYEISGFLSARILDYLYEDTLGLVDPVKIADLIRSFPDYNFQILSNHDCFRSHPNYGNDLRLQYNQILCDIKNSNLLPYIAAQVANQPVTMQKSGIIPDSVILNANYTLG